jgi:hypothetical protein
VLLGFLGLRNGSRFQLGDGVGEAGDDCFNVVLDFLLDARSQEKNLENISRCSLGWDAPRASVPDDTIDVEGAARFELRSRLVNLKPRG